MKALTYIEIDVDYCALRYGETNGAGTCPAVLGTDSAIKCHNTLSTCAVRPSFTNAPVTLRFAMPADYLPRDIEALPYLESVSYAPAALSLGEDLGQRSSLSLTFNDAPHSDTGPAGDKYLSDRDYDPYRQGSFWGKFRTRQRYLRGRPLRLISGLVGQTLAEMETRHFLIEDFQGPTLDGKFTLTAKDALKLADGDRAQAPLLSPGSLNADIDDDDTSLTLSPAGIGDSDYPASGIANIGGSEIVTFTRSGDTVTLTARAQYGTEAAGHNAGDRFQVCLLYLAQDPADVVADLFETYAAIDSGYIPIDDWQTETAAFYRRVVTALIPEPTSVNTLVSELVQQCGLAIWWDDLGAKLRLQVLRAIPTDAETFDNSNVVEGTLEVEEQPDKRISRVWTFFGVRNPLKEQTPDNFRSSALTDDLDEEENYGQPAIKTIYSRWIPFGGETAAERINQIQLGRYRKAPRHFKFQLFRRGSETPEMGEGCRLFGQPMQDATGALENVPIQIVRVDPRADRYLIEAEEQLFTDLSDDEDLTTHTIIITANASNVDLRTLHDSLYPEAVDGDTVVCTINSGVIVGSTSTSLPAFLIDNGWASGVSIELIVKGRIQGKGGRGGQGGTGFDGTSGDGHAGEDGGLALKVETAIDLDLSQGAGEIFGGGGGGGGGSSWFYWHGNGGGGGAGSDPGSGGATGGSTDGTEQPGAAGTTEAGGDGGHNGAIDGSNPRFDGGDGGGPGLDGTAGGAYGGGLDGGVKGNHGLAIDGYSNCTTTGTGDVRGGHTG